MPVRVLIVDDEPPILEALRRIAEREGYEVTAFADPRAAIAALRGSDVFPIVCTDYMMPHHTGTEVLATARQVLPEGSRILLTAASDFRVAIEAVNQGEVFRIVSKPWAHADLVATLRSAAEAYRLRQENRELTQLVQAKNRELHALNVNLEGLVVERTNNLLDGLISALDSRDSETQWHSQRVASFTGHLARALGVSGLALRNIEIGALLHDIGKIAVSDSILLKEGPLDPPEWEQMRRHPEAGWRMLQRIPYLHDASLVVLQHQERFDGHGYPHQLKGEDICLGARLFAIADTLDAITSDRPYRRAASYALARAEIERCAGGQFDPALVALFASIPEADWKRIRADVEWLSHREDPPVSPGSRSPSA